MASHSIFSLFLLLQLTNLKAQTGAGCLYKTCANPGQVRLDALFDTNGVYVRGCTCGCEPGIYDSRSPLFCAPPNRVNFDPQTLIGDCSCIPPTPDPIPNPIPDPIPVPIPNPVETVQIICENSGDCSCPLETAA